MLGFNATPAGAASSRRRAAAVVLALAFAIPPSSLGATGGGGLRAVSMATSALESSDARRRLVAAAAESGVTTVLVPIALDGPSAAQAEAIDALIRDAHARGLRVHAALQPIVASGRDELPVSRSHIIYRHPEWLMVPRELGIEMLDLDPRSPEYIGRLARWTRASGDRTHGIYLSPLHPEAVDYIAAAVSRIATRFPVDGIHLDGLHYPGPDFDYSRPTMELFRAAVRRTLPESERARLDAIHAIDPFGYAEERADDWRRFRISRMTGLVTRLRTTVRAVRPEALVSAAVVSGAERALSEHLQDWRTWVDNRFVDALADVSAADATLLFSYDALIEPRDGAAAAFPAAGSR